MYDRLASAPVKIAMECVSRSHPHLRNCFRPSWRDGRLWAEGGELLGLWRIDVQRARVRLHLQACFLDCVHEGMEAGLERSSVRLTYGRRRRTRLAYGWEGQDKRTQQGQSQSTSSVSTTNRTWQLQACSSSMPISVGILGVV